MINYINKILKEAKIKYLDLDMLKIMNKKYQYIDRQNLNQFLDFLKSQLVEFIKENENSTNSEIRIHFKK